MSTLRPHLRPLTWFATLVLVAFALLQSVALAHGVMRDTGGWAELCGVDGPKRVDASTGEEAPADLSGAHAHCPLCHLAADPVLAVLPAPLAWQAEPMVLAVPTAFLHAAHTLHAWASAQPRAPPSFRV